MVLVMALMALAGCRNDGGDDTGLKVDLALRPDPPHVGTATATLRLTDRDGQPVRGASVTLEGNMNHAGMTPSLADAAETEPGQ
jgi:hypothetical protein